MVNLQRTGKVRSGQGLLGSEPRRVSYGKLPIQKREKYQYLAVQEARSDTGYRPTLEEASVRLFRVVLFPAEGLPTRPISGSRGMVAGRQPKVERVGGRDSTRCNLGISQRLAAEA